MRVFFSAGEASGDAYAAEILKRLQPHGNSIFGNDLARIKHDNQYQTPQELFDHLREESRTLSTNDVAELVAALTKLGVEIPTELASGVRTTEELLDYISQKLTNESVNRDVHVQAVGGRRLDQAGADIVADSSKWGAVTIAESVKVSPRVIAGYYAATRAISRGRPGLFVPIDFGFINIKLARFAKRKGWKVLYFIPPGSWRKDKQGADLPRVTDAIVTPFPWSADILNKMGANAHYFGHPLKEMIAQTPETAERDGVAVLPGSRAHEIECNVPVIAQAIKDFEGPVRIAVAPSADETHLRHTWTKWSDHEPAFLHSAAPALKASRSAIVCSGTATLEAALCACPCVVMYRANWLMELEYRLRKPKFDYISLPNILLDRPLLKELILLDANPGAVKAELAALDADGPRRTEVLAAFAELSASLGDTDCLERTAELARQMMAP